MKRVVVAALCVELLVLAVTGVALFFVYRPANAQVWSGVEAPSDVVVTALRATHRVVSSVTVLTGLLAVVIFAATTTRKLTWAIAGALALALVAASYTGYLLPWDQLALWAVTADGDMTGYRPFLGDRVRFVLIGGTEVSPNTLVRWLGLHSAVLAPLALLLVVALGRIRSPRRAR